MLIAGAALFAKRKQKSEKWIVDENTVKLKAANAAAVAAAAVASEVNNAAAAPAVMTSQQSRVEQTQKMASVQVRTNLIMPLNDKSIPFLKCVDRIILTGCFRRTSSQVGEIALGSGPGRRNGEHGLPGALAQSSARSGQPKWNAGEKQGAIRTGGAYDAVGRRSGPAQAEHEASG